MYSYQLYGLHLESEVALPGFDPPVNTTGSVGERVTLVFSRLPTFPQKISAVHETIRYAFSGRGESAWISAPYGGRFRLSFREKVIRWQRPNDEQMLYGSFLLRGKVLGLFLSHQPSTLVLHGNVVAHEGKSVLFLAASWEGKSTLTAFLLNHGFSLLSDDMAVLKPEGRTFLVERGPREIKLWPWSASLLGFDRLKSERIIKVWRKKRFLIKTSVETNCDSNPPSCHVFYLLCRKRNSAIRIEPLKGRVALAGILGNVYVPVIKNPRILKAQYELTKNLLETVSVRRLVYSSGIRYLPKVRDALLEDLKKI